MLDFSAHLPTILPCITTRHSPSLQVREAWRLEGVGARPPAVTPSLLPAVQPHLSLYPPQAQRRSSLLYSLLHSL